MLHCVIDVRKTDEHSHPVTINTAMQKQVSKSWDLG